MHDIIEQSDAIQHYLAGKSFDAYVAEQLLIDAVERCLGRLTEAVIRIGPEQMRKIAPDLPMEKVRGLGNLLRHAYRDIDQHEIWSTAKRDLPALRAACERALGEG